MEHEDQVLLNDLKRGNPPAYEAMFNKYYKALAAKAYFMLDDEMEAEDLVQNLFVDFWQKQYYLTINSSLKAYLFKAVHNRCLICLHKHKQADEKLDLYLQNVEILDEEQQSLKDEYEQKMGLIFEELPVKRQQAFKLVYLEDKRYKEAAEEMGISVNSIKTHLKLAIRALQEKLISFK